MTNHRPKYCLNCGAEASAESRFCSARGRRFSPAEADQFVSGTQIPRTKAEKAAYILGRITGGVALFFVVLFFFGLILFDMETVAKSISEAATGHST